MAARIAVLTICSNNYVPQAEVLFATVRAFHPEADLVLGLADAPDHAGGYPAEAEIVPAAALGIPDFPSFAFAYDVTEFNTAIKPYLMLRLLERGYDAVLYFDPDIALYRRLDELLALLDGGASLVLTPHFVDPPGPGATRDEAAVMRTGAFNLGFVAAGRRPETEPALRWWARMLRRGCVNAQERGLFVDQKYLDLLPGLAGEARVLRNPAYNVAYWNIPRRRIEASEGGGTLVDGRPFAFFHFSGFDPERPDRLSRHAPEPPAAGALAALLADYAARRRAVPARPPQPYAYGRFASGVPIPDMVRRCFRDRHPTWSGDPFATYDRYARLPSAKSATGAFGERVTVLMEQHHAGDPALRFAFDLRDPFAVTAYSRFFAREARAAGVDESLWRVAA